MKNRVRLILSISILLFASTILLAKQKANTSKKFIVIEVVFKNSKSNDSLYVAIDNVLYPNSDKTNLGWYGTGSDNGSFKFVIPVKKKLGYWDLYKKRTFTDAGRESNKMLMLKGFLWEAGDKIKIQLSNKETDLGLGSTCTFTGKGSTKYRARYLTDSVYLSTHLPDKGDFDDQLHYEPYDQPAIRNALASLERFRSKMAPLVYEVLKADMVFYNYYNNPLRIKNFFIKSIANNPDSTLRTKFIAGYHNYYPEPKLLGIPLPALEVSKNYLYFLYNKLKSESYIFHSKFNSNWIVDHIFTHTQGAIRDRVLMIAIINIQKFDNVEEVYSRIRPVMRDENSLDALNERERLSPGKLYTDFDLPDMNGHRVRLSDFKGKNVLIDFWFNGCGYCSVFYKNTLSKIEKEFKDKDIAFVSICADISPALWQRGIESGLYTSENAINLYTEGKGFKHPLIKTITGFPFVILLDKSGIIRQLNSTGLYDYGKLSTLINALQ